MNLNLGMRKLGAKNLSNTWSTKNTPPNVPKNELASLFAVCKVIMWAIFSSSGDMNLKMSLLCKK